MSKILFGTDPEMASVYDKDGEIYAIPPYFFREVLGVPADKENPAHPVFLKGDEWKVLEDGANWEMAIRPSHNPRELFDNAQKGREALEKNILSLFPDFCSSSARFLPTLNWEVQRWKDEIKNGRIVEEDFYMSTQFGCDPDYDVFNYQTEGSVLDVADYPYRNCGGHIHLSGVPEIVDDIEMAVKSMVITAGLAAIAFTDVPALERQRTFFYGKPGKFRPQDYGEKNPYGPDYRFGLEYRTPSATWLKSWDIAQQVLKWAEIGISVVFPSKDLSKMLVEEISMPAIDAILSSDVNTATQLLKYVEERI